MSFFKGKKGLPHYFWVALSIWYTIGRIATEIFFCFSFLKNITTHSKNVKFLRKERKKERELTLFHINALARTAVSSMTMQINERKILTVRKVRYCWSASSLHREKNRVPYSLINIESVLETL